MKVSVEGRKQLALKLKKAAHDSKSNLDAERKRSAEHLLSVALPVTPMSAGKERGELRRSGYVDHTLIRDSSVVGFSAPYAVFVHEMMDRTDQPDADESDNPDLKINWTTPGTGPKFLTGPFNQWRKVYAENMKKAALRGIAKYG